MVSELVHSGASNRDYDGLENAIMKPLIDLMQSVKKLQNKIENVERRLKEERQQRKENKERKAREQQRSHKHKSHQRKNKNRVKKKVVADLGAMKGKNNLSTQPESVRCSNKKKKKWRLVWSRKRSDTRRRKRRRKRSSATRWSENRNKMGNRGNTHRLFEADRRGMVDQKRSKVVDTRDHVRPRIPTAEKRGNEHKRRRIIHHRRRVPWQLEKKIRRRQGRKTHVQTEGKVRARHYKVKRTINHHYRRRTDEWSKEKNFYGRRWKASDREEVSVKNRRIEGSYLRRRESCERPKKKNRGHFRCKEWPEKSQPCRYRRRVGPKVRRR